MTNTFFSELLQNTQSRVSVANCNANLLLDKNEQSSDVDYELKLKVMDRLLQTDWNRYPSSDYSDIESKIANYCNLDADNIVLASGSATIITCLLNYFALNNKHIVIAQPSYSLFDYHCKTYNINYTPWYLNETLGFDYEHMPSLGSNSVFIITSPNNPTGNSIDIEKLETLLTMNPESMIMLDGVYTEFCGTDITLLINKYKNLIVLRSFSKAFSIAGLRLGYLCATPSIATMVKKLILQFSITPFSLAFAREVLFEQHFMESSKLRVQEIIYERERVSNAIKTQFNESVLKVFPSEGNFLLIRIYDQTIFENCMDDLRDAGIKVLNTSAFALLQNTFRISIGAEDENNHFLDCLSQSIANTNYANRLLAFHSQKNYAFN